MPPSATASITLPHGLLLRNVFAKRLHDLRRSFPWWALALVATALMYASVYPTIRENAAALNDYVKQMPEFMRNLIGESGDFSTPTGYIQSEVFSFLGPILFLVFAMGLGARGVAGEEEAGTLDLLLSTPVRRRRVVTDTFLALVTSTAALALVLWASLAVFGPPFEMRLDLSNLAAACFSMFLLGVTFGTITLAAGAATGGKGLAIGVASGLALVTFIVNVLAPSVDAVKPFRVVSPFYYYFGADPLRNGLDLVHAGVLVGIIAASFGLALAAFERRDLAA